MSNEPELSQNTTLTTPTPPPPPPPRDLELLEDIKLLLIHSKDGWDLITERDETIATLRTEIIALQSHIKQLEDIIVKLQNSKVQIGSETAQKWYQ